MINQDDPIEYLRKIGENFNSWRRYNLLYNRDLLRKVKTGDNKIDQSFKRMEVSLSAFQTGNIADFLEAALEEMSLTSKDLLVSPPEVEILLKDALDPVEEDEAVAPSKENIDIDAASWVKYDKNTEAEKKEVIENIDKYVERHRLNEDARRNLVDMLTAPPRALKLK